MSAREWKAGEVALIEVGCWANTHVGLCVGDGWRYGDDKWVANDPAIITARPIVAIDPENRQQIDILCVALVEQMHRAGDRASAANGVHPATVKLALREFTNPKPPRPDEPMAFSAAVEDEDGVWWARTGTGPESGDWCNADGDHVDWDEIDVARILSDGVQP